MDEIIVKSLQYIIDSEREDAEVSNTVNLCEDDIEDGGRVFQTASASRSLPEEEDKKEAAFEIESIGQESDEEEEDEKGWAGEDDEEFEEEEDGEEEDYEMACRYLNNSHLSKFLSSDTREEIGSSSSSSSSSAAALNMYALVYSTVKVASSLSSSSSSSAAAAATASIKDVYKRVQL